MNFEQIRQAQALKSKLDKAQKELKEVTGGLKIPGLF